MGASISMTITDRSTAGGWLSGSDTSANKAQSVVGSGIPVLKMTMEHAKMSRSGHETYRPVKVTIKWGSWSPKLYLLMLDNATLTVRLYMASGDSASPYIELMDAIVEELISNGHSQDVTFSAQRVEFGSGSTQISSGAPSSSNMAWSRVTNVTSANDLLPTTV